MDERQLADALRGAVGDVPPPSFDQADVVRASRRITARRRSALAGGVLAVVALVGVGVAAVPGPGTPTGAAAPPAEARANAPEAPQAGAAAPAPAPAQDAAAPIPPLGPGDPNGCANPQDPALRGLVERVLPEAVGAPQAPTTADCRPGGERGMSVQVGGGVLSVRYLPPGTVADLLPGAVGEPTASGGTVVVWFTAGPGRGGPGVPAERVAAAAAALAPRL